MIKFLDLQKVNAQYKEDLHRVATKVIDSGWYLRGEHTRSFEKNLMNFSGSKHAVAVANGLDALRLLIRSYKEIGMLGSGDEVIVPANTYIASILSITDNGLKPVFVEPDLLTYNLDISKIEAQITSRTKAILVVHLYGRVCWSYELEHIAKKYNLIIIEDNAQAIGAKWNGKRTGNLGDSAGFSFYPGKNLGALGDSGAITTYHSEIAQLVRTIGNYGSDKKYVNSHTGFNSRMDEIQASFLNVKLKHLDAENKIRQEIAQYFLRKINNPDIILPYSPNDDSHVWHLFVVRTHARDKFQKFLSDKRIQTLIHYPIPPHMQQCFKKFNHIKLPITELIHKEVLSLPMSPVLTKDEIEEIVDAVNKWKP